MVDNMPPPIQTTSISRQLEAFARNNSRCTCDWHMKEKYVLCGDDVDTTTCTDSLVPYGIKLPVLVQYRDHVEMPTMKVGKEFFN